MEGEEDDPFSNLPLTRSMRLLSAFLDPWRMKSAIQRGALNVTQQNPYTAELSGLGERK